VIVGIFGSLERYTDVYTRQLNMGSAGENRGKAWIFSYRPKREACQFSCINRLIISNPIISKKTGERRAPYPGEQYELGRVEMGSDLVPPPVQLHDRLLSGRTRRHDVDRLGYSSRIGKDPGRKLDWKTTTRLCFACAS
jgi:hypothetical protein